MFGFFYTISIFTIYRHVEVSCILFSLLYYRRKSQRIYHSRPLICGKPSLLPPPPLYRRHYYRYAWPIYYRFCQMDRRNLEFGLLMSCLLYSPLPRSAARQTGKTKTQSGSRFTHTPFPSTRIYVLYIQHLHAHVRNTDQLRVENLNPEWRAGMGPNKEGCVMCAQRPRVVFNHYKVPPADQRTIIVMFFFLPLLLQLLLSSPSLRYSAFSLSVANRNRLTGSIINVIRHIAARR